MNYTQIKNLVKELKKQGAIAKSFRLNQKSEILLAEIKKNITKIDPTNISPELAVILINFSTLAIDNEIEAIKTPQKTTKKAARPTKKQEMTQKEFNHKFIQVYAKEQIRQELEGVVAMRVLELKALFQDEHEISDEDFKKLFYKVPNMFTVWENDKELCQVFFKRQKDGTYTIAA